jgi:hypothetical protein
LSDLLQARCCRVGAFPRSPSGKSTLFITPATRSGFWLERAMEVSRTSWSAVSKADPIAAESTAIAAALRQQEEFKQLLPMSPGTSSPGRRRVAAAAVHAVHAERCG